MARPLRILRRLLVLLLLLVVLVFVAGWLLLRASLPKLEGSQPLSGLQQAVTVLLYV